MQRLQNLFHVSLFTRQVIYIFSTSSSSPPGLRQNKLPWIYYCPAQCPNTEWYFLQTCCFYKLTPAGKMIFRVQFGIREYPAIQVFTFMLIISTSQGPQLTCIRSKWVGKTDYNCCVYVMILPPLLIILCPEVEGNTFSQFIITIYILA